MTVMWDYITFVSQQHKFILPRINVVPHDLHCVNFVFEAIYTEILGEIIDNNV